jgi:hypothetical protein
MDKQQKVEQLLALRENVQPLFLAAQTKMLASKDRLAVLEMTVKEAKIFALGSATGKNADQREAEALDNPNYRRAREDYEDGLREFNAAYAAHEQHRAVIAHIRDMTALLQLLD